MSIWKKLLWFGVAVLGTWAIAILALSRGEQISALWIVIAGFCALSISYRFYSSWLATKVLVLNEERATPAVLKNDNKDYVPTNRWMVFGHHFAAIAGPGPLVGPVLAAQFGFYFSFYDLFIFFFFFFNDSETNDIYTLSLHDALPIALIRALIAVRALS